jgi:hypothetical protein
MHIDLTDEETAAMLRELDPYHRGRPFSALAPHPDLEDDPHQVLATPEASAT